MRCFGIDCPKWKFFAFSKPKAVERCFSHDDIIVNPRLTIQIKALVKADTVVEMPPVWVEHDFDWDHLQSFYFKKYYGWVWGKVVSMSFNKDRFAR